MGITIDNLSIEVTRRCNQVCDHCLRGKAQNINIDIKYVNTLFSKINAISALTITGGEPSIAVKAINDIIDSAIIYNVEISNFYIATNGKRLTMPFIEAIKRLYDFCDSNDISRVEISNDKFHDLPQETRAFQEFLELEFTGYRWENRDRVNLFYMPQTFNQNNQWIYPYFENGENGLINTGLAFENGLGTVTEEKDIIEIREIPDTETSETLYDIIDGYIYLNCKGKILTGCNFSFEEQDDKNSPFFICDVNDFSIKKIKQHIAS